MMPLHPNFRRLLLAKIPRLKRERLNDYDALLVLRYEAIHQNFRRIENPYPNEEIQPLKNEGPLDRVIREITNQANQIIAPFRKQFDQLHRLWSLRRYLALKQGDILQIPTTWPNLRGLIAAAFEHSWIQFTAFWPPLRLRIKELSVARVFAILILIGLILYGITSLLQGKNRLPPETPQQQDAGQIPQ